MIFSIENSKKRYISGTFESRYSNPHIAKNLISEKEFIKGIVKLLEEKITEDNFNISSYIIKNQIIPTLKENFSKLLEESEKKIN